jgi:hypothetical protein
MHYSLHEIDSHDVVATTAAADFSQRLRVMLTFEGNPAEADYLLDEWPEGLLAHVATPTIPVFIVSTMAAYAGRRSKADKDRRSLNVTEVPSA